MGDAIKQIKDALSKNNNLNGNFANDRYTLGWIESIVDRELMVHDLKINEKKK